MLNLFAVVVERDFVTIEWASFIAGLASNPILVVVTLLNIGVIVVNGATDAPNAIATVVSTRAMKPKPAIVMAAVCNFLGLLVVSLFTAAVAHTIFNMVDFGGDSQQSLIALMAAMVAIIVWGTVAWYFGIPTSQSHSLIAGLTGAAIALQGSFDAINGAEWIKVVYGILLSTLLGFFLGWLNSKALGRVCRNMDRKKTSRFFRWAQVASGAGVAFMHGAQDGPEIHEHLRAGHHVGHGRGAGRSNDPAHLAHVLLRAQHGVGHRRRRRAHHKKRRPGYGEARAVPRIRRQRGNVFLPYALHLRRLAGFHDAHEYDRHHGRGRSEAEKRGEVGNCNRYGENVGADVSGVRSARIRVRPPVLNVLVKEHPVGKRDKFDYFDAFEKQTEVAVQEAELLIEAIESFTEAEHLKEVMERAHELEHKGDEINHAIFKTVATDFITPIEREDIINMSQYLDNIIDYIEDVMQRFYMYDVHFIHHDALEFAHLIKKSCVALDKAMEDFRNFKKSKMFKQLIIDVNDYEEEADQLYMTVIRKLHTHDRENPMRVLVWSQIFDRMEKCCDSCEHAADTMNSILLKNV